MSPNTAAFIRFMKNPFQFRFFVFTKLPAAWIAGVRIREIDDRVCTVSVPYKWLTRNPFRSTYFASLSMAAEMSTGALAMAHLYKCVPQVSMLVTGVDSVYIKKATGPTFFTCSDGDLFEQAVKETISSGEPRIVKARSEGRNKQGETVAEFNITWSFKARHK